MVAAVTTTPARESGAAEMSSAYHLRAVFRHQLDATSVVDAAYAEALGVAVAPLEVVLERPHLEAAQVDPAAIARCARR